MSVLKIVIEKHKHKPRMYKGKDMTKEMFFLPVIPWKWEIWDGPNILTYGYVHTEDDANKMANKAINQYRPRRA